MTEDASPRAYSIPAFLAAYGLKSTKFYEELKAGRIKARKFGRRTLIPAAEAERWLASLPELTRV